MCETVGSCDSPGCTYRSRRLISCPPYRRVRTGAAGPVAGSGPCPRRTLPTVRVVRSAHSAWWVPGAPAARAQPSRRRHPLRGTGTSWLDHSFVPAATYGLADSLRTSLLLDVNFVVIGKFPHGGSQDRRSRDPEAAPGKSLHVRTQFIQPRKIGISSQS